MKKAIITSLFVALSTAATSFGSTYYWFPGTEFEGGNGAWTGTDASKWSITSEDIKTSINAPSTGDSVIFGLNPGVTTSGVTVDPTASGIELDDWKVDAKYLFGISAATTITLNVNTFSGSHLSSTNIAGASGSHLILQIRGNTAFTGAILGSLNVTKTGAGRLDLSQANLGYGSYTTTINEGSLWMRASSFVSLYGALNFGTDTNSGGNLVVVGNGQEASSLGEREVVIGASDNTSGGFGARGGNLILNFGGVSDELSWGGSNFKATTFTMGTTDSTDTVILENHVSVDSDNRVLNVEDGAAAVDAELKGALKTGAANRLLIKSGAGTVALSGNSNAFAGRLNISEGKLFLDGSLESATTDSNYGVNVASGATLGGDGTLTLSDAAAKMTVNGVLQAGRGEANQFLTINANLTMGVGSVLSFAIKDEAGSDRIVRTGGDSWLFQEDQLVEILNLGDIVAGNVYELITGLDSSFASTYDLANWKLIGGSMDGNFLFDDGVVSFQVTVVPEPSVYVLAGLGIAAAAWAKRKARLK